MILNICILCLFFGMLLNFNYLAYPFHNNKVINIINKTSLQFNFFYYFSTSLIGIYID